MQQPASRRSRSRRHEPPPRAPAAGRTAQARAVTGSVAGPRAVAAAPSGAATPSAPTAPPPAEDHAPILRAVAGSRTTDHGVVPVRPPLADALGAGPVLL